jgi:hypothetical protein
MSAFNYVIPLSRQPHRLTVPQLAKKLLIFHAILTTRTPGHTLTKIHHNHSYNNVRIMLQHYWIPKILRTSIYIIVKGLSVHPSVCVCVCLSACLSHNVSPKRRVMGTNRHLKRSSWTHDLGKCQSLLLRECVRIQVNFPPPPPNRHIFLPNAKHWCCDDNEYVPLKYFIVTMVTEQF